MAGAGIELRVEDAEITAMLNRVAAAGLDPVPLHDEIGAAMVQRTQSRFLNETAPDGKKWPDHAKSTQRRRGPNAPKLRDRMRLYDSLTHNAARDYVEWGVNIAYAAVHQFGHTFDRNTSRRVMPFAKNRQGDWRFAKKNSRAKSRQDRLVQAPAHTITIPARPYLGLNDEDKALILSIGENYLKRAAEGK